MSRRTGLLTPVICMAAAALCGGVAASGQTGARLITERIAENKLVKLAGNTRPEVRTGRDMGAVADSLQLSHMYLQMKMSAQQQADADALMLKLHDVNSAEYHKWLTLGEIEERFGPSQDDIDTVTEWLEGHGFTVHEIYGGTE